MRADNSPSQRESQVYTRPTGSYDIPYDQVSILIHNLLAERPPTTDKDLVCYQLDATDPTTDVARYIETAVFSKYFKNDAHVMSEQYGPYEDVSRFFLTIDQSNRQPVGALRVIENSEIGLKTLNDIEKILEDEENKDFEPFTVEEAMAHHGIASLDDTWDVLTAAVMPSYRETDAAVQLYRALYTSALQNGINHFVSAVDTRPLKRMTRYLGIPFVPLMGSKPFSYLGSKHTQLVYGSVPDFYPQMSKRSRTLRGYLARKALDQLVFGKEDDAIQH